MISKGKAGRIKVVFAFLLLFGPALFLILISTRGCEHKFKTLEDFGLAKNYQFTDSRGKVFTQENFKGEIVIVTVLQSSCPYDCSLSFWALNHHIYQHIRKNNRKKMKQVKLISFITDGKGNQVSDLETVRKSIENNVEEYNPDIWYIGTGDVKSLYNFEHNKQKLLVEGNEFYGGQAFQELMLLLDKENHLRMVLSGKTEGMVRRMKEHIALLQKQYDKESAE